MVRPESRFVKSFKEIPISSAPRFRRLQLGREHSSYKEKEAECSSCASTSSHSASFSLQFSLFYAQKKHETGFEPAALALARRCSTTEPLVHKKYCFFEHAHYISIVKNCQLLFFNFFIFFVFSAHWKHFPTGPSPRQTATRCFPGMPDSKTFRPKACFALGRAVFIDSSILFSSQLLVCLIHIQSKPVTVVLNTGFDP